MSSGIPNVLKEWEVLEKEFYSVQVRLLLFVLTHLGSKSLKK